jgi:hypothetical protein
LLFSGTGDEEGWKLGLGGRVVLPNPRDHYGATTQQTPQIRAKAEIAVLPDWQTHTTQTAQTAATNCSTLNATHHGWFCLIVPPSNIHGQTSVLHMLA